MTIRSSSKRVNRASQRGAAMVEGIVVMTTMLCFLGMNVWAENTYGGKLDQANATRRDALYYASHSCRQRNSIDIDTYTQRGNLGGISGGAVDTDSGDTGAELPAEARRTEGALTARGRGEGEAVSRSWNTVSAGKAGQVTGSVLLGQSQGSIMVGRFQLLSNLQTNSYVICNERRYDNAWTQIFEFGWDFLKSAAGAG